jgi:hypothetical protein
MRTPRRPCSPVQLEVFQPRPLGPLWSVLPPEVKRRVWPPLVRLLRDHHIGYTAPVRGVLSENSNGRILRELRAQSRSLVTC